MAVNGWSSVGGSFLGCQKYNENFLNFKKLNFYFRTSANKVGLGNIAAKIHEFNFHALLIIGGYEVN